MRSRVARVLVLLLAIGLFAGAAPVAAEETRAVGDHTVVVGFESEPAYIEEANAVVLQVTDAAGQPVLGLDETMDVEVSSLGRSQDLPLRAIPGKPGQYEAPLVPPSSGEYTIRLRGEIGETSIDESFVTGEDAAIPNVISRTSNDYSSPGAYIAYGSLGLYFVGLAAMGLWYLRRRRAGGRGSTATTA